MYDALLLLNSIDANKATFLTLSNIALIFNYIFFIGAAVAARRDKVYCIPLFLGAFWLAHDVSYLVDYNLWFHVYDHWYLKLFWAGLLVTSCLEMIFLIQIYQYGKQELMPNASDTIWGAFVLGAIAVAIVIWFSLRTALNDPIFAYSFGASGAITPFLCFRRLADHPDGRGQSVILWIGYVGMQATWFATTYSIWGQGFRSPTYVLLGAICIISGIVMAYLVHRARAAHFASGRSRFATA